MDYFLALALIDKQISINEFSIQANAEVIRLYEEMRGNVYVEAGTFKMGQHDATILTYQNGDGMFYSNNEQPVHEVTIQSFIMSPVQVTLAKFRRFMNAQEELPEEKRYKTSAEEEGFSYVFKATGWEKMNDVNWRHDPYGMPQLDGQHPVIHVSWVDAVAYCNWLSLKEGRVSCYEKNSEGEWICIPNRNGYRLPTEAEWEYAAQGGRNQFNKNYAHVNADNDLNRYAWNQYNSGIVAKRPESLKEMFNNQCATHPVKTKEANALGLYDMIGNVLEWCEDDYHSSYLHAPKDGIAWVDRPKRGTYRVLRGGSWDYYAELCRSANRDYYTPSYRYSYVGFRLSSQ